LQQEEKRLHGVIQSLQAENEQLLVHLRAIQQVQPPVMATLSVAGECAPEAPSGQEATTEPEWMLAWRQGRTFARESLALTLMGESGKALRPSLVEMLARRLDLSPTNSSLSEAFNRLLNFDVSGGLIEALDVFQQAGASTGGNHPDLLRLTERGKDAYHLLTGKPAVENEYERLIRKHKSPEHTVLNIQAAEALAELGGYVIIEQAPEIQLPDGSVFIPDLVAQDGKTGEIIFVDVERETGKDRGTRTRKWKNVLSATNGNLYVVCDNIRCERAIQTEINQALGEARFNSRLTNLNSLRKGKRAVDGGIWLSARKMR